MIDEGADGQLAGELRHAAHVVLVEVRDQQVIDCLHAGVLGGRGDAVGVAAVVAGPAGIDQHGFAGGRHEERGLTAFDIDEVDLEILGGGEQGGAGRWPGEGFGIRAWVDFSAARVRGWRGQRLKVTWRTVPCRERFAC